MWVTHDSRLEAPGSGSGSSEEGTEETSLPLPTPTPPPDHEGAIDVRDNVQAVREATNSHSVHATCVGVRAVCKYIPT